MSRADCGFRSADGVEGHDLLIRIGPTIFAAVAQPAVPGATEIKSRTVPVLVDTGASHSCIDADLARELELPVIDKIPMSGIGGAQDHEVVMCQITIPSVGHTMSGRFACVHLAAGGQPHRALFGRDFLKHVVMIYDGESGRVTIMK